MLLLALLAPPRCLLRFLAHWLLVLPGLLSHVSTYLSVFSWLPAGSLGLNPYPGKKFSCCFAVLRAVASVAIWGRFWRNLCERRLLPCRGFGARLAGSVWPRFDCTGRRRLREGSLLPDRSLCLGPFAFWAVLAAAFGSKGWGSRGHLRRRCWIEQKKIIFCGSLYICWQERALRRRFPWPALRGSSSGGVGASRCALSWVARKVFAEKFGA